ncbi:MAG: protein tyrosine phosphatase [Ignavibacteriae bacterium HGW-Ignavibacteriae-4]|nr:MAG: protein tyrosine phosphatase [Ignavibacteriae bacterium HGW-Ignavibacteriae-4]
MNIVILCRANSCRSQLAEALFRKHLGNNHNVFSAGLEPEEVNANAVKTMAEIGIDISNHTSKTVDDLPNIEFDYVITVCNSAKERCPVIPGNHKSIHHWFPDPSKVKGTEEEIATAFASVRDEIDEYAREFVSNL